MPSSFDELRTLNRDRTSVRGGSTINSPKLAQHLGRWTLHTTGLGMIPRLFNFAGNAGNEEPLVWDFSVM